MSADLEKNISYSDAIREAFVFLLENNPEVFVIGQGLWSPWYVGNTMTDLDKLFGVDRIMDTPVSESATTGVAIGASLCGLKPIVIHPRLDFMILAMDPIVNQAAKWSSMLGGQAHPAVTIRGIINRGGEQGAQHSQALHSWFSHIPGLRVVMPYSVSDARDLLIASVLCEDPVLYIDDRWLYETTAKVSCKSQMLPLEEQGPQVIHQGVDLTLVGSGYSTYLCLEVAEKLKQHSFSADVVDLRVLNPIQYTRIVESVKKTGRLLCVDGGWSNCGLAGEIIAGVMEQTPLKCLRAQPKRVTLPPAPAPTSKALEKIYYPTVEGVLKVAIELIKSKE